MRRANYGILALLMTLVVAGCADVGEGDRAETGAEVEVEQQDPAAGGLYAIDTSRSTLRWVGAKVTNSHEGGFYQWGGTVSVGDGEITHVRIDIDPATIWTDSEKLIGHLKSPDFFDVEKYPTATFEADNFTPYDSAGATHMVTGNLTMRGQTNSISFPAKVTIGENEVRAEANFIVDRQNWGIIYPGAPDDLISDDVRITFDITASPEEEVTASR